jgi:hypothetical protein
VVRAVETCIAGGKAMNAFLIAKLELGLEQSECPFGS